MSLVGNFLDDLWIKLSLWLLLFGLYSDTLHVDVLFLAGWGSSLKLLETQKQLQAKKCVLQNVKVCESCNLRC